MKTSDRAKGPYQGHLNWCHWNVALYLAKEEPLYRMTQRLVAAHPTREDAAKAMMAELQEGVPAHKHPKTPDGAKYTVTAIRAALVGWAPSSVAWQGPLEHFDCDVCLEMKPLEELTDTLVYGIETTACDDCFDRGRGEL